jgi:hypothetical protein
MKKEYSSKENLSKERIIELIGIIQLRFEKNIELHKGIEWANVQKKLEVNPSKLTSLNAMEETGGEPDVVGYDKRNDEYLFFDCSEESPKGRRSLCYDSKAWESRKENKPKGSAMGMASEMGIEVLNEEQYQYLQQLGKFDNKTSSWLASPESIRKLGGAIFGDYRFGRVFIYHNGAESYYAGRAFRGCLRV